jgi:predicted transcriptional regulator/transcriptional regulator with XRE-family HTH domain
MARKKAMMGYKVRRFRQDLGLNQSELADQLGISPSYLNLIEHNQRPVTVPLLFRLGETFDVDLRQFAEDDEARHAAGLQEVFSDPLFDGNAPGRQDIRELAAASPAASQGVIALYSAYRAMRDGLQSLARDADGAPGQGGGRGNPLEEVREFQEAQGNHFPAIEAAAEAMADEADFDPDNLYGGLVGFLRAALGISVTVMPVDVLQDTMRRFDRHQSRILLSEALPPSGRIFHLAAQIALLSQRGPIDAIAREAGFVNDESAGLLRLGLANAFAGAVMMPYDRFLGAARALRYDVEILRRRFGVSFEQAAHRLTTLQRQGWRGVPFFFVRIDTAGNVSKRLSGGGFQFGRFGGACPRWIVHDVFRNPGVIHTQLAQLPDGGAFLTIARTVQPVDAGWRAGPRPLLAVGFGCDVKDARHLVYGDGMDLASPKAAVPIGVSCRMCDRLDCNQRAHPPMNHRLRVEEHIRRLRPYAFAPM